jgi:PEP-CTERM motif
MKRNQGNLVPKLLAGGALLSIATTSALASLPFSLGQGANYAVLGLGGISSAHGQIEVYQSGTVINGNVGAGPYADWTHGIDATINGRVDYDLTDSAPIVTGTITGGVHPVSMSGAVTDVRNASTSFAGLAPTLTLSTLSEGQTIVGNGGLNVIRITGDVTLKTTLTLQGTANDSFVFQLTAADAVSAHTLTLSGLDMNLTGGLLAQNVLWDMNGLGGGIVISSGSVVEGIFLAPDRGVLVDASTVTGSVIGGGGYQDAHSNLMSVHSTSTINSVPEPGTGALLGLSALTLMGLRRKHN